MSEVPKNRSFAQFGEDVALLRFFGADYQGFYVDVGANDGVLGSNSYLLELHGWRGLLIEPSAALADACRTARPASIVVNRAAVGAPDVHTIDFFEYSGGGPGQRHDGLSSVGRPSCYEARALAAGGRVVKSAVSAATLDAILQEYEVVAPIDFLSIDVEGAELDVLRGFSLARYRPRLVIIEDNTFGQDRTVAEHLARYGYRPIARSFVNVWYAFGADAERRVGLRYSLWSYLEFKLLSQRLGLADPLLVRRAIESMLSAEGSRWGWLKAGAYRLTPVWLLEAGSRILALMRRARRQGADENASPRSA
jgi:FkbM family methyltransferase